MALKRHVAQLVAVAARPAAVDPRAHDQRVGDAGALLFDGAVGLQRAEQVLGVEPAADGHHRRLDVLEVRAEVARLPELVVGAVLHHLVPERDLALEVLRLRLASGPISRKNRSRPACRGRSGRGPSTVGSGRGWPKREMKLKACGRKSAPLWWKSSPTNQSVIGACGEAAFSAGWASIMPAAV